MNPILIHNGYFAEFAGIKASFTLHVLILQFRCYWDNHISNNGVEMEKGATRISLINYTFGPSSDTLQQTSNKYYIF